MLLNRSMVSTVLSERNMLDGHFFTISTVAYHYLTLFNAAVITIQHCLSLFSTVHIIDFFPLADPIHVENIQRAIFAIATRRGYFRCNK